jgi:hypothetical protein
MIQNKNAFEYGYKPVYKPFDFINKDLNRERRARFRQKNMLKRKPSIGEKKDLKKLFNETGQRVDKWIETGDRMFGFIRAIALTAEKSLKISE